MLEELSTAFSLTFPRWSNLLSRTCLSLWQDHYRSRMIQKLNVRILCQQAWFSFWMFQILVLNRRRDVILLLEVWCTYWSLIHEWWVSQSILGWGNIKADRISREKVVKMWRNKMNFALLRGILYVWESEIVHVTRQRHAAMIICRRKVANLISSVYRRWLNWSFTSRIDRFAWALYFFFFSWAQRLAGTSKFKSGRSSCGARMTCGKSILFLPSWRSFPCHFAEKFRYVGSFQPGCFISSHVSMLTSIGRCRSQKGVAIKGDLSWPFACDCVDFLIRILNRVFTKLSRNILRRWSMALTIRKKKQFANARAAKRSRVRTCAVVVDAWSSFVDRSFLLHQIRRKIGNRHNHFVMKVCVLASSFHSKNQGMRVWHEHPECRSPMERLYSKNAEASGQTAKVRNSFLSN